MISTNNIGCLGIGQCGGNIVDIAFKYGYNCAVINTSPEDLASLEYVRQKLHIPNNGGCGKNRNEGIEVVKKYYNNMIKSFKEWFKEQNLIFIFFSTGGGTGSGITPILTNLLKKMCPEKRIILVGILPNNIECLKEIYNLNLPTFLIDNEKFMAKNKHKSRKELFDLINTYTISNFNLLFNSDREMNSKYGTIDNKDLIKLFDSQGMMIITKRKFKEAEYKEKGIESIILDSIDMNIYSNITKNGTIARIGFIYEVPTKLMSNSTYELIKKELGTPIEIFEGFREINDNDDCRIITILSGLTFPKERIQEYNNIISNEQEKIKFSNEEDIFGDINKSRSWLSGTRSNISIEKEISEDDIDIDALFSQY
jgi:cell division GTPase FtsZ